MSVQPVPGCICSVTAWAPPRRRKAVAPIAAALLQLALSRSREFEADRTGAELIGDGPALASALAKIDRVARQVPLQVEPAQASKYLVHPLAGRGSWTTLFMTHPPVEQRIARLIDLR